MLFKFGKKGNGESIFPKGIIALIEAVIFLVFGFFILSAYIGGFSTPEQKAIATAYDIYDAINDVGAYNWCDDVKINIPIGYSLYSVFKPSEQRFYLEVAKSNGEVVASLPYENSHSDYKEWVSEEEASVKCKSSNWKDCPKYKYYSYRDVVCCPSKYGAQCDTAGMHTRCSKDIDKMLINFTGETWAKGDWCLCDKSGGDDLPNAPHFELGPKIIAC